MLCKRKICFSNKYFPLNFAVVSKPLQNKFHRFFSKKQQKFNKQAVPKYPTITETEYNIKLSRKKFFGQLGIDIDVPDLSPPKTPPKAFLNDRSYAFGIWILASRFGDQALLEVEEELNRVKALYDYSSPDIYEKQVEVELQNLSKNEIFSFDFFIKFAKSKEQKDLLQKFLKTRNPKLLNLEDQNIFRDLINSSFDMGNQDSVMNFFNTYFYPKGAKPSVENSFELHPLVFALMKELAFNGKLYEILEVQKTYQKIMRDMRKEVYCTIYSPNEVDSKDKQMFKKFLEPKLEEGEKLFTEFKVDKKLLAGYKIVFGEKWIQDLTIHRLFDNVKEDFITEMNQKKWNYKKGNLFASV